MSVELAATRMTAEQAIARRQALEEMLHSDGWRIFAEHIATVWGPAAFEQAVDKAMEGTAPEDETAVMRRIRDTFKGVRASMQWPQEELRAMTQPKPESRFAAFRRGPG